MLETTYSAIGLKYQSLVALMHREQLPVFQQKTPGLTPGFLYHDDVRSHHATRTPQV